MLVHFFFLICLFGSSLQKEVLILQAGKPIDASKLGYGKVISAHLIDIIKVEVMRADAIQFPHGETLKKRDEFDEGDYHSYDFASGDAEADITVNKKGPEISGSVIAGKGNRKFVIENLRGIKHAWIELDPHEQHDMIVISNNKNASPRTEWDPALVAQGRQDSETMANVSVAMYYTSAFKRATPNLMGVLNNIIAITNQGYENSGVKIRLNLRCAQEMKISGVNENDVGKLLKRFMSYKGSIEKLRGTSDIAMLMTAGNALAGIAQYDDMSKPVGVATKFNAEGGVVFGHEVGHIFGLHHDRKTRMLQGHWGPIRHPNGEGKLLAGKATIMAYPYDGRKHINYYSGKNVKDADGTLTGNPEDSVRVMNERRFIFQGLGDESQECPDEQGDNGDDGEGDDGVEEDEVEGGSCPSDAPHPYLDGARCCGINLECFNFSIWGFPRLHRGSRCCLLRGIRCPHTSCNQK